MENKNKCCIKTSIGGQALIEGIMMRGPKKTSMAVRKTDGTMVIETNPTVISKSKVRKIPVIRGAFAFVESMISGYKALMRSAELSMPTEEELEAEEAAKAAEKAAKKAGKKIKESTREAQLEAAAAEESIPASEENPASVETAKKEPSGAENNAEICNPAAEELAVTGNENAAAETLSATGTENAEEASDEADSSENTAAEAADKEKKSEPVISSGGMTAIMIVGIVLGLALSLFLFKLIPETLYQWTVGLAVEGKEGYGINLLRSAFTGVIKIIILVGYMAAVSLMKDIRRTFMYHGAEHKTIFCYEKGMELTVENVRIQTRFHPRCGTSFIILSLLVSIFFTMFIPATLVENSILNVLARTGLSLLLLPVIMGVGYELIRFAGKHDNGLTKVISAPGVWLQHITTKEPDDSMIECAIAAVKEVIPEDGSDKM